MVAANPEPGVSVSLIKPIEPLDVLFSVLVDRLENEVHLFLEPIVPFFRRWRPDMVEPSQPADLPNQLQVRNLCTFALARLVQKAAAGGSSFGRL